MNLMELDQELTALGTSLIDESMTIVIDGMHINALLDQEKKTIYFYCYLSSMPSNVTTAILHKLMNLNTMGVKTGGGHLSIVDEEDALMYSKQYIIEEVVSGTIAQKLRDMIHTFYKLRVEVDAICEDEQLNNANNFTDYGQGYNSSSGMDSLLSTWIQI